MGKGTLIKGLLERVPGLQLAVSATTRRPREGEVNGVDYHFLSADDFDRRVRAEEFLEHAEYAGNRYGTLKSELSRPARGVVLEIDVQGARQIRERHPDAVQVFIEPPSFAALEARLAGRGSDQPEQIERRLAAARAELDAARRVRPPDRQRRSAIGPAGPRGVGRYHVSGVIKPRLDKLLDQVDSHYACVLVAAKRARQINSYYHNLGEGTFDEYPPPMVETGSKNYLKIALEEVAASKIKYRYR